MKISPNHNRLNVYDHFNINKLIGFPTDVKIEIGLLDQSSTTCGLYIVFMYT